MAESEQNETPPDSASRWKLISFLLAGVLIPIMASLLPWIAEHWVPENRLTYSIAGPISAPNAGSFSLEVRNSGRSPQSNLEIWIPLRVSPRVESKTLPNGRIELNEVKPNIILETSTEPSKKVTKDNFTVLYFEKVRPDESIKISLFHIGGGVFLSEYELERMRIVSDNTFAKLDKPDEDIVFMYKVGSILFAFFLLLVIGYGIYYEKFMPVSKKRAELIKQLEKLDP